jgi:hypothetical protein
MRTGAEETLEEVGPAREEQRGDVRPAAAAEATSTMECSANDSSAAEPETAACLVRPPCQTPNVLPLLPIQQKKSSARPPSSLPPSSIRHHRFLGRTTARPHRSQ